MTAFEEFGVLPEIGKAVDDMGWTLPTDVQVTFWAFKKLFQKFYYMVACLCDSVTRFLKIRTMYIHLEIRKAKKPTIFEKEVIKPFPRNCRNKIPYHFFARDSMCHLNLADCNFSLRPFPLSWEEGTF